MTSYLLVVFVVVLSISERSVFAEETYQNVTIWNGLVKNEIAFITSSTTLKNNLPSDHSDGITLTGKIPVLYENSVSDINNIKIVTFLDNEIQEIRPGAFRNLPSVVSIEIIRSNLTTLQKGVFSDLSVEQLLIVNNYLSSIDVGAFRNLPKLKTLNLSGNKLKTIDENVFEGIVNLETLDLSSNLIAVIPKIFEKIPHLKALILSRNNLSSLPRDSFRNVRLSRLDLSHNQLEYIPEGIFNNLTLTTLNLEYNQISGIAHNAFDNMPNLETIDLSGNKISKYNPDWFQNSRNVSRLFLSRNLIKEIPDDSFRNIIYNSKPMWIDLEGNKIKAIFPNSFRGIKKFDSLSLAENELESWNEDLLKDTESIFFLNLPANRIKCVDGEFDKIFIANFTHLGVNPLDPQCKERIRSWASNSVASRNQKQVCTCSDCY